MTEILLIAAVILQLAVIGLQLALLFRKAPIDFSPIQQASERTERAVRDEFSRNRTESATTAQQSREAVDTSLKNVGDSLDRRLGAMRETIEARLTKIQDENTKKLDEMPTGNTHPLPRRTAPIPSDDSCEAGLTPTSRRPTNTPTSDPTSSRQSDPAISSSRPD